MRVEFDKIAEYIGELYAAAKHDLETADPCDVGLGGVSIIAWREAYLEGCKDMAEGILTRVSEAQREEAKKAILDAFHAETTRIKAGGAP